MIFNNAIIQQLAFFTFVCIAQLFVALWYMKFRYVKCNLQLRRVVQCDACTYHIEYQHFSRSFTFSKPINLFSNNKPTHLHFLHMEVAILLLMKCIRSTHDESHEYFITSCFISDKQSIWMKEVRICEDAL